jgi:hypothetical protein
MTPPGIDSGIKTVTDGAQELEQWAFKVDSVSRHPYALLCTDPVQTDPLWFYCRVGQHCANGMVFSVNPTAEKTHEMFLANAQGSGSGAAPSGSGSPSGGASASQSLGSGAPSPSPSNGALQTVGHGSLGLLVVWGLVASLVL